MDCQDYITESVERKKGQHLQREERGAIQHLKNAGYTNRAIARAIGCSPTTVGNELKRGTPPRKSSKGRKPGYSARRGEAVYKANRKRSRKPHRICHCTRFIRWIMEQVKEHKWSLDACVGYARLHKLFSAEEKVCTHTLYNEVWAGSLDLSVTELPEAMKRKQHKDSKPREHRKSFVAQTFLRGLRSRRTRDIGKVTRSHRSSRPLPWTTARSSLRSVRSRTGAVQSTLRIPTPRGNVPKTNVTTGCFEPSFRRACPLRLSLLSISWLQLMN